jgi:hypothetical protein
MLPVLAEAERELARDLSQWLATIANGEQRFTAREYRNALIQMRGSLARMKRLAPELYRQLERSGEVAGSLAVAHLVREVADFSLLFDGVIRHLPLEVTAIMAEGKHLLLPQFAASARRYGTDAIADIKRQLAVGVVRGETFGQLTHRLMRLTPRGAQTPDTPEAQLLAEGLFKGARYRAERIVRTEVIHAYDVHTEIGLREAVALDPEITQRWDATRDGRTCGLCRDLDGLVVAVGALFAGDYSGPPAHPCCRCCRTAWRADWPMVAVSRNEWTEADRAAA